MCIDIHTVYMANNKSKDIERLLQDIKSWHWWLRVFGH
jgi:hypothetical protein